MRRRRLLRLGGACVGGALATAAGVTAMSDPAGAQTALSLSIDGAETTLGVDESISRVVVDCDVNWSYDLPDGVTPETVIVELAAGTGESLTVVGSAESPSLFGEADGSESFESGLIENGVLTAGEVRDGVPVTVEARLRVEDSAGEVLAREKSRDSAEVRTETESINATQYGSVGGSGELRIETV